MNWNQEWLQELYGSHATRTANQLLAKWSLRSGGDGNGEGGGEGGGEVLLLSCQTTDQFWPG